MARLRRAWSSTTPSSFYEVSPTSTRIRSYTETSKVSYWSMATKSTSIVTNWEELAAYSCVLYGLVWWIEKAETFSVKYFCVISSVPNLSRFLLR